MAGRKRWGKVPALGPRLVSPPVAVDGAFPLRERQAEATVMGAIGGPPPTFATASTGGSSGCVSGRSCHCSSSSRQEFASMSMARLTQLRRSSRSCRIPLSL